jgi:hypothetical protein
MTTPTVTAAWERQRAKPVVREICIVIFCFLLFFGGELF